MKVLDKYILRSFFLPFFATFLVILFIFVMQTLWLTFDKFAGRGITPIIVLKFMWYTVLSVIPLALPVGILLSSIMSLGNFSEKYEFAAAKSAGISLRRLVRPLTISVLILSVLNFIFLNNIYPYARLKQLNLKNNVKNQQPTLALTAGNFNSEIPNYQIKFDEKFGKNKNFLKNVIIYDLSANKGNIKSITAEEGEIVSEKGSRYMTLVLKNGNFFEHYVKDNFNKKMPASYATFDQYIINIDVSKFLGGDLDEDKYTKHFTMLNMNQLKDTIPILKRSYDEFITNKANSLMYGNNYKNLYPKDSIVKSYKTAILANFDLINQEKILKKSLEKVTEKISNMNESYNKNRYKRERKILNLYDIEYYNRIALSLSCILLFFIGAPLGSIIKKGGMGLPMVSAILIYVVYHFTNTMGRNMAEESTISAFWGSWFSTITMTPLAIFLTIRAAQDKNLGSLKSFFTKITLFFTKFTSKINKNEHTT